jgi:hypothetical protein
VRVHGPLDVGALRESLSQLTTRHEALRTRIVCEDGLPKRQHVNDSPEYPLETVDLSSLPAGRVQDEAARLAREFFERKIDLSTDALFAAALLKLSGSEHVLLMGLDHIVGDGVSCALLNRELWAVHGQITQDLPSSLPEAPIQFPDYAVWEAQTYEARRSKDEAHWAERNRNAPTIRLPGESGTLDDPPTSGAVLHLPFGKALSEELRTLAEQEHTLLPIVALSIYLVAMSRWCDQTDWPVLFVSHARHHRPELQNLIGYLSRALLLRVSVSSSDRWIDLVKQTHAEFTAAIDHQDFVPPPPLKFNHAQAFNWGSFVTYSTRWTVDRQRRAASAIRLQPFPLALRSHYTFYPSFSATPAGIVATVHYHPDVVDARAVERLGRDMRHAGEALVRDSRSSIGSLRFSHEPPE